MRKAIDNPVKTARKRIRDLFAQTRLETPPDPEKASGERQTAEEIAKNAEQALPVGKAGMTVTPEQEDERLRLAAADVDIIDPIKQEWFVESAKRQPVVSLDVDLEGSGLLVIEHLTNTVVVRINRRHPFVKQIYKPLRDAISPGAGEMDKHEILNLLRKSADGIDLQFFAYAMAENQSRNPDEKYEDLREDWGKFTKTYIRDRTKMPVN